MQNVFDAKDAQEYINRINNLTPETQRKWGQSLVLLPNFYFRNL